MKLHQHFFLKVFWSFLLGRMWFCHYLRENVRKKATENFCSTLLLILAIYLAGNGRRQKYFRFRFWILILIKICFLLAVPPSVQPLPRDGKFVVRKGSTITLECESKGNPPPTIIWQRSVSLFIFCCTFFFTTETFNVQFINNLVVVALSRKIHSGPSS